MCLIICHENVDVSFNALEFFLQQGQQGGLLQGFKLLGNNDFQVVQQVPGTVEVGGSLEAVGKGSSGLPILLLEEGEQVKPALAELWLGKGKKTLGSFMPQYFDQCVQRGGLFHVSRVRR